MKWIQFKLRFHEMHNQWADLFLIDTAFRDIITKYNPALWRIHRRYAKDPIGHQLSLLLYIDKLKSPHIEFEFRNSQSMKLLEKNNLIKSFSIESFEPGFEKTSDLKWDEGLQKSWPYFIHGVSRMLMDLIAEKKTFKATTDIDRITFLYKELNNDLSELFTEEGQYAFMHHIAALFDSDRISMRT